MSLRLEKVLDYVAHMGKRRVEIESDPDLNFYDEYYNALHTTIVDYTVRCQFGDDADEWRQHIAMGGKIRVILEAVDPLSSNG